ncbi:MAG: helix-turn-helix transcriptional regulator [Alphaproteobacteria bacterium]
MREALRGARRRHGWSQAELGRRVGLPQAHISGIETGRIVPRFDTMLDLVRVLGLDLVLVPKAMVPIVRAMTRGGEQPENRPLYAHDPPADEDMG